MRESLGKQNHKETIPAAETRDVLRDMPWDTKGDRHLPGWWHTWDEILRAPQLQPGAHLLPTV